MSDDDLQRHLRKEIEEIFPVPEVNYQPSGCMKAVAVLVVAFVVGVLAYVGFLFLVLLTKLAF